MYKVLMIEDKKLSIYLMIMEKLYQKLFIKQKMKKIKEQQDLKY